LQQAWWTKVPPPDERGQSRATKLIPLYFSCRSEAGICQKRPIIMQEHRQRLAPCTRPGRKGEVGHLSKCILLLLSICTLFDKKTTRITQSSREVLRPDVDPETVTELRFKKPIKYGPTAEKHSMLCDPSLAIAPYKSQQAYCLVTIRSFSAVHIDEGERRVLRVGTARSDAPVGWRC
jgi:hypothetical protein